MSILWGKGFQCLLCRRDSLGRSHWIFNMDDDTGIPIVDIGGCFDDKELVKQSAWKRSSEDICRAFKEIGFVYIINHGIPDAQVMWFCQALIKLITRDIIVHGLCFSNNGLNKLPWTSYLHAILRTIGRGVSDLATDSPCGVWGRGWTTCLLHDSPLFGSHFKMRVGM